MSPSEKSVVGKIRAMRHPLFLGFVVVNKIAAGVVVSRNRRRRSVVLVQAQVHVPRPPTPTPDSPCQVVSALRLRSCRRLFL